MQPALNRQKQTRMLSIRQRLIGLSLVIFILSSIGLTYFVNQYANRSADSAYDKLLIASALTIAGSIQVEKGKISVELPLAAFDMLTDTERVFYSIRDETGTLITGYEALGTELKLMDQAIPQLIHAQFNTDKVRIVSLGHLISSNDQNKWITIRVAETTDTREALSQSLFRQTLIPIGCLMLIGLWVISMGLKYALAPLTHLEQELITRRPDILDPLTSKVPKEIQSLVATLNLFMARLSESMNTLTSMVSDTAHQLKTPLASISAQAEVALLESDYDKQQTRLIKIYQNANHASQLVHQILMDATVSHRLDNLILEPLTLDRIIEELYLQISPDEHARINDNVIMDKADAVFLSDRIALREMIGNLLQNALIYTTGLVELTLTLISDRSFEIRVADRGNGIPDSHKTSVFERFERGDMHVNIKGSGLGLSIVKKVVLAHHGTIELLDREGGGLLVVILLPVKVFAQPMPQSPLAKRVMSRGQRFSASCMILIGLLFGGGMGSFALKAQANDDRSLTAQSLPNGQTLYRLDPLATLANGLQRPEQDELVIAGTTDTPIFERFIEGYLHQYPNQSVRYIEMPTRALYEGVVARTISPEADLIISSASDLQFKLANDGFALQYDSPHLFDLPKGTQWRGELFGFSLEPIVIVYNKQKIEQEEVPKTHLGLIEMLEQRKINQQTNKLLTVPPEIQHYFSTPVYIHLNPSPETSTAVGSRLAPNKAFVLSTFDISKSGVGYLIATQDASISSDFWRLANALDSADVVLQDNSTQILTDLSDGKISMAYNVLGAYAYAKAVENPNLVVILPQDYVLVFPRTVFISKYAPHLTQAKQFIDFLLSNEGQLIAANHPGLGAIRAHINGQWTPETIANNTQGVIKLLELNPTLLVGLDQYKRSKFVQNWLSLVTK